MGNERMSRVSRVWMMQMVVVVVMMMMSAMRDRGY